MGVITTDNPKGAGRPTDLTDDLIKEIKKATLQGGDLKTIAKNSGIDEQKLYNWHSDNYLNISDLIAGWRRDRKLALADSNIEGILCLGISDDKTIKVVADMSKFVKETLDKENYSKRSELTGKGGTQLIPENTKEIDELTVKLNEIYERPNQPSDGKFSSIMGDEVQDKE